MLSATDGFGVTANFTYRPLTDASIYTRGTGAVYPEQDQQPPLTWSPNSRRPMAAGSDRWRRHATAIRGCAGICSAAAYWASSARTITNTVPGMETRLEETRRQDFPYTGLLAQIVVRQGSGAPVSETTNSWATLNLGNGPALRSFPFASTTTLKRYEVGGSYGSAESRPRRGRSRPSTPLRASSPTRP